MRIESTKPNAVVLDLDLPRVSGLDVQRELKHTSATHDIPIVVVTGTDTSDLNPIDVACILRKPISVDELVEAVQRCVPRSFV
jgi:DNA-binding response OmpR family regulator